MLDPREHHNFVMLGEFADDVKIKRGGAFMHMKAYAVDGELLRSWRIP